jgi:hypothetical protein
VIWEFHIRDRKVSQFSGRVKVKVNGKRWFGAAASVFHKTTCPVIWSAELPPAGAKKIGQRNKKTCLHILISSNSHLLKFYHLHISKSAHQHITRL